MKWSNYNYIYDSVKHGKLLFNFLSGAFIDINDAETEALIQQIKHNPTQSALITDQETIDSLLTQGIICENDDDNKNMLICNQLAYRFGKNARSLTLIPTLECNLACPYCFEESYRKAGKMSAEVITSVKKHIEYHYGRDKEPLKLSWFGGEPLLGFDIMEDITSYIKELEIPFIASIITNGVLLDEKKIAKIDQLNLKSIQITLDGPKEVHDTKRIFKNGKGTYDIIMKNLDKLHEYKKLHDDLQVDIRINVDRENKDRYHELYLEFKDKYPLFYVYPGIIIQYKTCSNNLPCFADAREEAQFYIEQYEKYGIIHPEFNVSAKGLKSCMAECLHTDMIGPRGELYLCLQDVGNPAGEIGTLAEGKNNMRLIAAYCTGNLTFNSSECRDCRVLTLCGGGCVNKRYQNLKCDGQHYVCAAYKDTDILERYLDIYYEIKKNQSCSK
ncbi:radical SAM/SPASM domain-containing protein [Tidjanibacter massiliensis]|uniref:radical SAM/SPASM domain-containing protein n=1 Tax=Tidjanibacter massiliensis TaxID=1871003 RepID=UPI0008F8A2E1|nr:radical SAM protein [Tidjanibacter massiliensis]